MIDTLPQFASNVVSLTLSVASPIAVTIVCWRRGTDGETTFFWVRAAAIANSIWFLASADGPFPGAWAVMALFLAVILPGHLRDCHARARLRDRLAARCTPGVVATYMRNVCFKRLMGLFPPAASESRP